MKTLAITGSTGKIGYEIVKRLARENYNLILINRNINKSLSQKEDLLKINPNINIEIIKADMSNLDSVFEAIDILKTKKYEYLILCSGIFNEKVYKLDSGYNNIFTVNFISQYLIAKSAIKYNRDLIKVVPVSSISYKFAKTNNEDIDYSNSNKTLKIYGNSKKFLIVSF